MKNLNINVICLGSAINRIKLPQKSTALDLVKSLKLNDSISLYSKNQKLRLPLSTQLENEDTIILGFSIRGDLNIKCKGRKWTVHKNDRDPKPSDFHAHDYENKEVLDLYTGKIYKMGREIRHINKTDLKQIRDKLLLSSDEDFKKKANEILNSHRHKNT